MTPQQLKAMKLALETIALVLEDLKKTQEKQQATITAIKEALAEHAMRETQRLGQEIEEPWCMKMNGCKTKCEDCPEAPPQSTEPLPQKKVWTFWDLSGGDITDAIKAKLKEKNCG